MLQRFKVVLLMLATLSLAGLVYGQSGANGTIVGTVTDNTGAVLANASVDVTNTGTNVTTHATTTSSGDFTVPYLNPGEYKVTVTAPNFQKSVTDKIGLVVGQTARVNVTMKAGAVSETVEVQ